MSSSEISSQDIISAAEYSTDLASYLGIRKFRASLSLPVYGLNTLSGASIVIRHASNVYCRPHSRLSQCTIDGPFGCAAPHIVWLWLCLRMGEMCQLKLCKEGEGNIGFQVVLRCQSR